MAIKDTAEGVALPLTKSVNQNPNSCIPMPRDILVELAGNDPKLIAMLQEWDLQNELRHDAEDELAEYKRSLNLCSIHLPNVWEGDGTCVLCESLELYIRLKELKLKLRKLSE